MNKTFAKTVLGTFLSYGAVNAQDNADATILVALLSQEVSLAQSQTILPGERLDAAIISLTQSMPLSEAAATYLNGNVPSNSLAKHITDTVKALKTENPLDLATDFKSITIKYQSNQFSWTVANAGSRPLRVQFQRFANGLMLPPIDAGSPVVVAVSEHNTFTAAAPHSQEFFCAKVHDTLDILVPDNN